MNKIKEWIRKPMQKFMQLSTGTRITVCSVAVLLLAGAICTTAYALTIKEPQQKEETKVVETEPSPVVENTAETQVVVASPDVVAEPSVQQIDTLEIIPVSMKMVSMEKDLKIKFLDGKGKLVTGSEFSVTVKSKAKGGKETVYTDDDKDGIIYKKDLKAGNYAVSMAPVPGYSTPADAATVEVKDKIEYVKIDVTDEVKTESQVNVAAEDTAKKEAQSASQMLTDTVTFVESKSEVKPTYTAVDKGTLVAPVQTVSGSTVTYEPTTDAATPLKDTAGNLIYITADKVTYVQAAVKDYYTAAAFYKAVQGTVYYGWQELNGNTYYYDSTGKFVTGEQVISGVRFNFASDGSLIKGSGTMGIDVSKYNGTINWEAVKNSGVSFAIIRCGYRGTATGVLVEDPKFRSNLAGASAAGLKVGVYFYTQAISEAEAVEEASMVLGQISGSKISYPVFIDTEGAGRAGSLDKASRTAVCNAFCATIKAGGYTPGVYASKSWFEGKLNASALSSYKIWLAQYTTATKPSYGGKYDLWQYTSKGSISGVKGNVDINYSYLGY